MSASDHSKLQQMFDSYCKTILRNKARDLNRHKRTMANNEIAFSAMTNEQKDKLIISDKYFNEKYEFEINNYKITVSKGITLMAISNLKDENRNIILLYYFMDMTDKEISEILNIPRRTVQYRRLKSLQKMRNYIEQLDLDKDE